MVRNGTRSNSALIFHVVHEFAGLIPRPSGFLTPAFVACSTKRGEGLVKLIMCNDVPGHWVEEWHIPYAAKVGVESGNEATYYLL